MQRRATTAVALTLGLLSAPAALFSQPRGSGPGPDTPRLLVAVFASNDRASGVQAADAIRNRVSNAVSMRQLFVIPKEQITNYLESSGYKADSSLGAADLRELAKLLRADEVVFGTVTRSPSGLKVEPRLALARDVRLAQPLPSVDAANPQESARSIERSYQEARKQLGDQQACENHIRAKAYDKAIAAANAGIAKYPNATLARLCLANVFQDMKAPPDSALRVLNEIIGIDPKNSMALGFAFVAYQQKGDQENAVRALIGMLQLEPTNQTLLGQVVNELGKLGKPSIAIPIVDTLLLQNPGDPQLLRQKWLLTLAAAAASDTGAPRATMFGQAVTAGEAMARADTMLADSTYYERQILAASAVTSQPQKAVEIASRATVKFPRSAPFWALRSQSERKAGQLQTAEESIRRALQLDPKTPNGNLLLATINLELNRVDTAVAIVQRAVAAGEDAKTWGAFLLGPTNTAWKLADSTKATEDYLKALALAEESDKLSPSATAKFFVGVSSFYIGINSLQEAQKIQAQRAKACPLAKMAQDMFLKTQIAMPGGGAIDANTARTVLGYVAQYSPSADQMVKQFCK